MPEFRIEIYLNETHPLEYLPA